MSSLLTTPPVSFLYALKPHWPCPTPAGLLPEEWGQPSALPVLRTLRLDANQLEGDLPESWGQPGAFAELGRLSLNSNGLEGSVPEAWGATGFPAIELMYLYDNPLCGAIPANLATAVCCLLCRAALRCA
jgi:hypothetical protein